MGVLILTHRRLLVSQFNRELAAEGYGDRLIPFVEQGTSPQPSPITVQTYAWFARHHGVDQPRHLSARHRRRGTHGARRKDERRDPQLPGPDLHRDDRDRAADREAGLDVFPASVDDLPLQDAARRGLIAPLRNLRLPPAAAIHSVPIVGGDFEERALAAALDHQALNQAAASLYRDRFDSTPGIVYAAGVDHAYNLAQEFRAAGIKAEAVSGRTLRSSSPRPSPRTSEARSTS